MTSCWIDGFKASLSPADDLSRKLKYTLNLTNNQESWILVNTHLPNKIVEEGLVQNKISELTNLSKIQKEFKIGKSRFDFYLEDGLKKVLLEVKSATSRD